MIVNRAMLLLGIWALSQILLVADPKPTNDQPLVLTQRVVIPKNHEQIKIDGNLSESVWKQAAAIKSLLPNDGTDLKHEQAEVRLWYNEQALFLGWICRDTNIQATFTNRDDHLWEEDVVEFFVTPNELSRYFEFQWNPLGTVFDAVVLNRLDEHAKSQGYKFDPTFMATNLTSAVTMNARVKHSADQDEGWQVEAMIPFADLNQAPPKPNEVWRANFFRINRGKNQTAELSSWSQTITPWFHQPSRFGYLEFGK